MSTYDRRAVARRRAWGRGPMILRFDSLEGRQLLSAASAKADLLSTQFSTVHSASWGNQIAATGTIANRGKVATTVPVEVDIYASSTPTLTDSNAVTELLGSILVPAGLAPRATYNFNQLVTLPPNSSTTTNSAASQTIYLTLNVDPNNAAHEASLTDKASRGVGLDTSPVVVSQQMPADLEGNALSVSPIRTSLPGGYSWGDAFSVSEQIKNVGQGNSPPTRARIVLTPAGANPGGYSDVTIGNINVPAIPAFQTTNVVQPIILPPIEPLTLGLATQFTISVVQDGDFLTQPVYPRIANVGPGFDQGPIGISPGPLALAPQGPTPDLAPSTVLVSQNSLYWGQQFQVSAVIQNVSNVGAGPFTVRFIATGASGDVSHGVFLGDVQVPGLAANGATNVLTTVQLPAKLPFGTAVASPAYSQVYAIADPEDVINESLRSNNMASSAPILLQVVGTDGTTTTVPTYPQNIYTSPTLILQAAKQAAKSQTAKLGTPKPASSTTKKHKVDFLASISEAIVKQITGIPKGVNSLLKNIGASGGSNGSSAASTTTSTASQATPAPAAATNTIGSPTSGGTGGFGATPLTGTSGF
jgi:hypothetical protein